GRVAELPAGVAAGPVVAAVGRGSGRGRAPRPGHHRADQEAGEQPVHGVAAVVAVGVGAVRRATLVPRNHAVAVAHLPGVGLGAGGNSFRVGEADRHLTGYAAARRPLDVGL